LKRWLGYFRLGRNTTEPPPAPSALDVTVGDRYGELDAYWDTVAGAKSYVIETSEDQSTTLKHAGVSTKAKYHLADWLAASAIGFASQPLTQSARAAGAIGDEDRAVETQVEIE